MGTLYIGYEDPKFIITSLQFRGQAEQKINWNGDTQLNFPVIAYDPSRFGTANGSGGTIEPIVVVTLGKRTLQQNTLASGAPGYPNGHFDAVFEYNSQPTGDLALINGTMSPTPNAKVKIVGLSGNILGQQEDLTGYELKKPAEFIIGRKADPTFVYQWDALLDNLISGQANDTSITFPVNSEVKFEKSENSDYTLVEWRLNGAKVPAGDVDANQAYTFKALRVGQSVLTLVASKGGKVYTSTIKITVSLN